MIRLVRRPTVWTWLALLGYLALLWFAYHNGNYCLDQERDVWMATPFMLVPLVLPLVIHKVARIFCLCFSMVAFYTITPFIVYKFNIFDNTILLYYIKWMPRITDETFIEWYVESIALNLLVSAQYGLIGVLAAKTYRLTPPVLPPIPKP